MAGCWLKPLRGHLCPPYKLGMPRGTHRVAGTSARPTILYERLIAAIAVLQTPRVFKLQRGVRQIGSWFFKHRVCLSCSVDSADRFAGMTRSYNFAINGRVGIYAHGFSSWAQALQTSEVYTASRAQVPALQPARRGANKPRLNGQ